MPFPNEHAARQEDPDRFRELRRTHPENWPTGINAILGDREEIQSVRFDKDLWTEEEALRWLRDHGFNTDQFEPAGEGNERVVRAIDPETIVRGLGVVGPYWWWKRIHPDEEPAAVVRGDGKRKP